LTRTELAHFHAAFTAVSEIGVPDGVSDTPIYNAEACGASAGGWT
jgi:hypothetical protein